MFKKGQRVVRVLRIAGIETATLHTIGKVTKASIHCVGDEHLKYDPTTGREIDAAPGFAMAGISSRIIPLEGE